LSQNAGCANAQRESSSWVPKVPADYYRRIREVEERHWWHRGMRAISAGLLGDRLRSAQRLLDAGCGTGGFLRWALERQSFEATVGVDVSSKAIEIAKQQAPDAELHTATIWDLPLATGCFDLVVVNDVLQHLPEARVDPSLRELRRVVRDDGTLLVRTNGARRFRRRGQEWRVYDQATLTAALAEAGFQCERLTHANLAGSLWAAARGSSPRAPSRERHGIPPDANPILGTVMYLLLRAEAGWLRRSSLRLPYGHTLFAVAIPEPRRVAEEEGT
jgi:2-polyprenyl-3-methyl-5-hydroxy-6-metoxy-1,4-benzoquinol methylase